MIEWIRVNGQEPKHDVDLIIKDEGGVVYSARYLKIRDDESYFFIRMGAESFVAEWNTDTLGIIEYYSYLEEA